MAGLKRMGMTHVAYEASSHGLDQSRAEGVPLAAAAFTNFSRDHLDYHETMDAYFEAKMRLFDELLPAGKPAVIWTDDPKSDEVIERSTRRRSRGDDRRPQGRDDPARRTDLRAPLGQTLMLEHDGKAYRLALPLIGAYQASNVLTAAGLVLATGRRRGTATFSAMQRVAPVRGRLERAVISRAGVPVYIDYAHTPDALEAAIAALRPHVEGRLITVFGAGGDRDQGKRPEMGAVATRLSDVVIVTDDNPRSEDPARIRADIMAGAPGATEVGGRREAIAEAIRIARRGRHRPGRRQGPRDRPDRRRPRAAVRRRAGRAGVRGVSALWTSRRDRRRDRRHRERAIRSHRRHLRQPRGRAGRPVRRHAGHGPRRPQVRRRRLRRRCCGRDRVAAGRRTARAGRRHVRSAAGARPRRARTLHARPSSESPARSARPAPRKRFTPRSTAAGRARSTARSRATTTIPACR